MEINKEQVPCNFFESFLWEGHHVVWKGRKRNCCGKVAFCELFSMGVRGGGGTSLYASLKEELLWESGNF